MFHTGTVCLQSGGEEVRPNNHTGGLMASLVGANQCVGFAVCFITLINIPVCTVPFCDAVNLCLPVSMFVVLIRHIPSSICVCICMCV